MSIKERFWQFFWFVIRNRAFYLAKKRGVREDTGGWLYQIDKLRIEASAAFVRVSVPVQPGDTALVDDGNVYWRLVFWVRDGKLKIMHFGPWAKEIGRLCRHIKCYNMGI